MQCGLLMAREPPKEDAGSGEAKSTVHTSFAHSASVIRPLVVLPELESAPHVIVCLEGHKHIKMK
jgi:hypothetical protein